MLFFLRAILSGRNYSVAPILKRHRYGEEFKRDAVKTLLESGRPVTAVALDIGIEQSILHKWKKIFGPQLAASAQNIAASSPELAEVEALRRELAKVRETLDQLKNVVNKTLRDKYI
jgi:transposase-like protein